MRGEGCAENEEMYNSLRYYGEVSAAPFFFLIKATTSERSKLRKYDDDDDDVNLS